MHGRKRSLAWLWVQVAIVFCYTITACCKPYRQEIHQKDNNSNNQGNNETIFQVTNNPSEHSVQLDKVALDLSLNHQTHLENKDSLKTNTEDPLVHKSVIFKAIVSNVDVLTVQEENSNGVLSKHHTETQQVAKDANGGSNGHKRLSKAHLKWDGHVVAAPLKYDPQTSNFQTPKKVSDTVSTSKMVLSLLTAAAALGSICLTVAIFQCCCRRKRTSDDEDDDDQIESDQCNKEKASVKAADIQEQQSVEPETSEKNTCVQRTTDVSAETPVEQTTTNGEAVQEDTEAKEEEQVSVKDKIKAFETQALKPFSTENAEQHRTLIKRPQSRVSVDGESEALSTSTTLIMGQVFRKRADTEKCQRKETISAPENNKVDDDYFGVIGRETEILKSYRRAPAPRNRNKATKALYRKTMPIMDSGTRANMEISMSDWESTMQNFQQTESPFAKQESKKKPLVPLPLPNQKAKEDVDNKLEDSSEKAKVETKTEESMMEGSTVSAVAETNTEKPVSTLSTGSNTRDASSSSSSSDETSQGEETKIKEEIREETNKEEKEVEKEKELKDQFKNEEEEKLQKEEKEKEKLKKEAELKEKEEKLKEEEKINEEKLKEEELNKEKKENNKEPEVKKIEKEIELKTEKVKPLKKEKELKREKDEVKREKEELNKEELKKGKEQLEKDGEKTDNIFLQIDPTAEPTAAKLVKRDSDHESSETSVLMRHKRGDSPQNDQSPKSRRHLSYLDRSMYLLPGQKPENQMSLMMSLKEKLNDKKEKNELDADADTDTKMDVDTEPEMEKSETPEGS